MAPGEDARKMQLIASIAAVLDATDYKDVRSRFRPHQRIEVQGTQSTEVPDLFAVEEARRCVLCETVTLKELGDPDALRKRLYLFYTSSEKFGWEFQLACFKPAKEALQRFCARWGIRYSKIWDL